MMRLLISLLLLTSLLTLTQGQDIDGSCAVGCDGSCCSNFLMDNPRREIIDFNATFGPGTYYGIAVKLCTEQPFAMGLWAPAGGNQYVLYYGADYPGTDNAWNRITRNGETYYAMNFTTPWSVNTTVFFGVMGISDKIPIPYSDRALRSPRISINKQSIQLVNRVPGQDLSRRDPNYARVQTDSSTFPWNRSFRRFVHLCGAPGCTDEAMCTGCRGPRGYGGPPGPPGPPGPAGPSFAFDAPDLEEGLNGLRDSNTQIVNTLTKLEGDINRLNRGDRDTGICPRNFVSGSYGIGYCYYFWSRQSKSFGEAALGCRSIQKEAHLLDIENEAEDTFLADTIVRQMRDDETNLTFYTSGLYSLRYEDWVWYSDQLLSRKTVGYSRWAPQEETGYTNKEMCLVYQVFRDKTTSWISSSCNERRGYICKKMKKCF